MTDYAEGCARNLLGIYGELDEHTETMKLHLVNSVAIHIRHACETEIAKRRGVAAQARIRHTIEALYRGAQSQARHARAFSEGYFDTGPDEGAGSAGSDQLP